eukprot:4080163-Prymnesium_polylepis.1
MASFSGPGTAMSDNAQSGVHVTFNDHGGVLRVMELHMPPVNAAAWVNGLQTLLDLVPRVGTPAHCRWALSCQAATSERGATGFIRRLDLQALLVCANASAHLGTAELDEAMRCVEESEQQLKLP